MTYYHWEMNKPQKEFPKEVHQIIPLETAPNDEKDKFEEEDNNKIRTKDQHKCVKNEEECQPEVNDSEEQEDAEIHQHVEDTRTKKVHHHVVKVSNF
jgi:hypothetical protein